MNIGAKTKQAVLISTIGLGFLAAGCASSTSSKAVDPADPPAASLQTTTTAQTTAIPRVQDCGIIGISSPPKYVCGGKVYTATQLAKIRDDEAKKYRSGK